MQNQFFYTFEEKDGVKTSGSFNMDMVIRSLEYEPGKINLILNDWHEETRQVQVPASKSNPKAVRTEFRKQTVCSEIWLNEEDSIRFREMTEYKKPIFAGFNTLGNHITEPEDVSYNK